MYPGFKEFLDALGYEVTYQIYIDDDDPITREEMWYHWIENDL